MTALFQFVDAHFRKIYWLLTLVIIVGSALSFFVILPVDETTMSAYVLAYWLPIFLPTAIICLLTLYAVVGTFRRTRTWWGTLGYLLFTCAVTVYAFIAFLVVPFYSTDSHNTKVW